MNILFIMPLHGDFYDIVKVNKLKGKEDKSRKLNKINLLYPNGLLSISAYMQRHKPSVNIRILDFNISIGAFANKFERDISPINREAFWEYCLSEIDEFIPDVIGISALFSSNFWDLNPLADFLRNKYVESLIACGGHLPSSCYEDIFAHGEEINAICFGEGEKPFLELINAIEEKNQITYLQENNSWITKKKILSNKNFKPINNLLYDLDEIPPYDFDLIVRKPEYENYNYDHFSVLGNDNRHQFAMFTTRGCPGKCVFCASHNVHGHKIREYSILRIKQDVLYYREKWGVDHFLFSDDHFLSKKERAIEVLEFMIENKIPADVGYIAFFSVNEEIAKLLKRAGIKKILIAVENANEKTLKDIIHKPGNLDMAKKAIKLLRDEGLIVISNILVGLPGETKESIDKGVENMLVLGCSWYVFFIASPLPGSELFEICKKNDYLPKNLDIYRMNFYRAMITTPDFDPQYIEKKTYEINMYVNFVKNYDLRTGNYEIALLHFEQVINFALDTHAFAYYFAAICAKHLNLREKYINYKNKYEEMIEKYSFWKEWAEHFELDPLEDIQLI